MNQKIKRIIYGVIGTILMVLDFVTLYIYYSNYTRKNDPFEIKDKIKENMKEHNLKEEDYNFEKVFWNPNKNVSIFFKFLLVIGEIIVNIAYLILGVFGFIIYISGLPDKWKCPFVTSIIICSIQLFEGLGYISNAFSHSTLNEKDLTDFGELNDIINKTYDLYLERKLNMKLSGFYLLFSPLFFIVTSFIEICRKNKNNNIQPINQYNPKTNEPLMVKKRK